jgi:predicted ATPase
MQQTFGKLQRLTVEGFKSIRAMDRLDLTDINIVVGQNGAGKSNFVSVFRFLAKIAREELQDYIIHQGGLTKLLYFGPKITRRLEIYFRAGEVEYEAVLKPTIDGELAFEREAFGYNRNDIFTFKPDQTESQLRRKSHGQHVLPYVIRAIEHWRVYHFHDTSENAPLRNSASLVEPERLAADGRNLAAFLYFLQERHPDTFEAVLDTVRQIAPFLGTLVLRPEALNPNLIRLRWRHVGHDELFDVSDLSDGTLRFIALTALLLQPDPPSTIVLDEPELGLHPAAIAQLAALIHQVAPQVQIIAATQSPTFANHFGWRDFIIADRHEDASRFRRLKEEEVSAWMDEYAMGEIWEKNLIGGRP